MPSLLALRHAPWSLSKVSCALRCPKEFEYRYVAKIPEKHVAPDTRLGKAVHVSLEAMLGAVPLALALDRGRKELLSDEERRRFDELGAGVAQFGTRIAQFRRRRKVETEFIEFKVAVDAELAPTGFSAPEAFFRGVWDVGFLFDDGLLAIVDHKTGIRRELENYAAQLEGYALLAAAHVGHARRLWLGVHFVADAAMEWHEPVEVSAVRRDFAPRLLASLESAGGALAAGFDARPSRYCGRCAYRPICPAAARFDPPA